MRPQQEGRLSGTHAILTGEGFLSDFDPLRLEEISQCERRSEMELNTQRTRKVH